MFNSDPLFTWLVLTTLFTIVFYRRLGKASN